MTTETKELLFASCTRGLEPALEAEARELGLWKATENEGVLLEGPRGSFVQANLWLSCATAVDLRNPKSPKTRGKDTSGTPLYKRGWREEIGRAPLRETLGAGLLRLAGWNRQVPLWDITCGSGTIVIEAATWAAGKAPGGLRTFAFEGWPAFDRAAHAALARSRAPLFPMPKLRGSDLNAGALGVARRNARRAGVTESVEWLRMDARALPAHHGVAPGLVVGNLPYGHRASELGEVPDLYRAIGASVRAAFAGWRFAFLVEHGASHLGLAVERDWPLDNGGLDCHLIVGTVSQSA